MQQSKISQQSPSQSSLPSEALKRFSSRLQSSLSSKQEPATCSNPRGRRTRVHLRAMELEICLFHSSRLSSRHQGLLQRDLNLSNKCLVFSKASKARHPLKLQAQCLGQRRQMPSHPPRLSSQSLVRHKVSKQLFNLLCQCLGSKTTKHHNHSSSSLDQCSSLQRQLQPLSCREITSVRMVPFKWEPTSSRSKIKHFLSKSRLVLKSQTHCDRTMSSKTTRTVCWGIWASQVSWQCPPNSRMNTWVVKSPISSKRCLLRLSRRRETASSTDASRVKTQKTKATQKWSTL